MEDVQLTTAFSLKTAIPLGVRFSVILRADNITIGDNIAFLQFVQRIVTRAQQIVSHGEHVVVVMRLSSGSSKGDGEFFGDSGLNFSLHFLKDLAMHVLVAGIMSISESGHSDVRGHITVPDPTQEPAVQVAPKSVQSEAMPDLGPLVPGSETLGLCTENAREAIDELKDTLGGERNWKVELDTQYGTVTIWPWGALKDFEI